MEALLPGLLLASLYALWRLRQEEQLGTLECDAEKVVDEAKADPGRELLERHREAVDEAVLEMVQAYDAKFGSARVLWDKDPVLDEDGRVFFAQVREGRSAYRWPRSGCWLWITPDGQVRAHVVGEDPFALPPRPSAWDRFWASLSRALPRI